MVTPHLDYFGAVEKGTSRQFIACLFSWFLPCQPRNKLYIKKNCQTCFFFHCLVILWLNIRTVLWNVSFMKTFQDWTPSVTPTYQTAERLLVVKSAVSRESLLDHGQRVVWVVGEADLVVALPLRLGVFRGQLVTPLYEKTKPHW